MRREDSHEEVRLRLHQGKQLTVSGSVMHVCDQKAHYLDAASIAPDAGAGNDSKALASTKKLENLR